MQIGGNAGVANLAVERAVAARPTSGNLCSVFF